MMNPDEHPDGADERRGLEDQAAELQRKRDALDAEQQQLERELRRQDLARQEEALEQQRRDLEAQRQAMESQLAQPVVDPRVEQQRQAAEAQAQGVERQREEQQHLHLERDREEQQLLAAAAREQLPADGARGPQGRDPSVIAGLGIAMLAIGALVGWFGYNALNDDDESIAQVVGADSTDTAANQPGATDTADAMTETTTAIPALAIDSSVWAHPDGTLQANLPDDWVPSWQSRSWPEEGIETSILRSVADPLAAAQGNHDPFVAGSILVARYTRTGLTPAELLGLFDTPERCSSEAPAEPFNSGDKTGLIVRLNDCGTVAGHGMQIALQDGNDAVQYMTLRAPSADALETYRQLVLSTGTSLAGGIANLPRERSCVYSSPSPDPDLPFVVNVSNLTQGPVTWFELDPATGAQLPEGQSEQLEPFTAVTNTFQEGTVIRIERPEGNLDLTVTADPIQCVNITDQGLEPA